MRFSSYVLALSLGVFIMLSVSLPVQAEEDAVQPDVMQPVQTLENPYQNELRKIALELSTSLTEPELKALDQLRIAFGMVRAVELVEGDVNEVVGKCATENPEIAEAINARHQAWAKTVSSERVAAEGKMEDLISSGMFKEPAKIKAYFEATDKVATFIDEQMDKKMVTTPEACDQLLKSMDETETKLTGIFKAIEWPGNNAEVEEKMATEEPDTSAEAEK